MRKPSPLVGKRLLHLGAGEFQIPAIEKAKKLGCFVIVTDNIPSNRGHRLADVSEHVSTVDLDGCLALARQFKIDGVMTYGSDASAPTVAYVSEGLGLPGNPYESAQILQRKDRTRTFQSDNNLPHPHFVVITDPECALTQISSLELPIIVKPVDSSGSKGQTVVRFASEVNHAAKIALEHSRCGHAIIEEFLEPDMLELDGDIWIKNGKISFRQYGHNYFSKKTGWKVPIGEIFPGFYSDEVANELDRQFAIFIKGLGLQNGCMNFDGLVSGGKVHLLDVSLRNGGNFVPLLIQRSTDFDLTEAAIFTALGHDYPSPNGDRENSKPVASYILNSSRGGRFMGVDFDPAIRDFIVESRIFADVNSPVLPFTRGDRALGVVFFEFPDMVSLQWTIENIEDLVQIQIQPEQMP